jgi:hypothetical protein
MGFRDPLTTADAIDTGHGSQDAGVRLYQDLTVPGNPVGVAEWRTGSMDSNATITLTGAGSGGSSYAIDGGTTQLVDAPEVDLNVEEQPDGSLTPVLRLKAGAGGRIVSDVALDPLIPKTALPLNSAFFAPYDAGLGNWNAPSYTKLATGDVVVTGLVIVTSASFAFGTTIGTLPPGCRPGGGLTGGALVFACSGWNNATWRANVNTNGTITLAANGPGATSSVNSYLSLSGIRFPAEA